MVSFQKHTYISSLIRISTLSSLVSPHPPSSPHRLEVCRVQEYLHPFLDTPVAFFFLFTLWLAISYFCHFHTGVSFLSLLSPACPSVEYWQISRERHTWLYWVQTPPPGFFSLSVREQRWIYTTAALLMRISFCLNSAPVKGIKMDTRKRQAVYFTFSLYVHECARAQTLSYDCWVYGSEAVSFHRSWQMACYQPIYLHRGDWTIP